VDLLTAGLLALAVYLACRLVFSSAPSAVWRKIYLGGPAFLTVLVAAASIAYGATLGPCQRCSGCCWGADLVPFSWAVAAIWHVALIVTEREKRAAYLGYGLFHLPVMVLVGLYSLGNITGDWL
jgi:hypothetical protein